MIYPLADEFLLLSGEHSFLIIGRAGAFFGLRIETFGEEYSQTVEPDDLVVVSAPEGGAVEPACMLAEFVRTYHMPLIVLPKNHAGSKRFSYLVSVGPTINTSCTIQRGTHPEQHLVCSGDELAGVVLEGQPDSVKISGLSENILPRYLNLRISTGFS
ncbi:alpha/beta hydrolase [uncultured Methanoregula sp.]|uniref:alpha/beta hydrolase n=1 Tax=uncultured Methanoregula sp. TaxID=1005933 RepID=UPI002AAA7E8B|nr:alpha/beta hydrolase [uncultured Methanoregula sp.]